MSDCWAEKLPRLYEIFMISQQDDENNYFRNFNNVLRKPDALEAFKERESALNQLDEQAWDNLKNKARHYVRAKHRLRRYEQFISYLNEAKGYLYLKQKDFSGIHFLQEGSSPKPDLCARDEKGVVLLEVKTINYSDEELRRMYERPTQVRDVPVGLPERFKNKLGKTIAKAHKQLFNYEDKNVFRRIIYLIIKLDPSVRLNSKNERELESLIEWHRQSNPEIKIEYELLWM